MISAGGLGISLPIISFITGFFWKPRVDNYRLTETLINQQVGIFYKEQKMQTKDEIKKVLDALDNTGFDVTEIRAEENKNFAYIAEGNGNRFTGSLIVRITPKELDK